MNINQVNMNKMSNIIGYNKEGECTGVHGSTPPLPDDQHLFCAPTWTG